MVKSSAKSSRRRTITVVTGSRGEFGLLVSVIQALQSHTALRVRLVVAGLHYVTGTWRDVCDAGFVIDANVRMQRKDVVGRAADVEAVSRGVRGFGRVFAAQRPDAVLVLGDRIEAFAAASAAAIGGWHLIHLHGGDRAEGVADESMRHAISKMAHVHFPATPQSRKRLIRMGEDPSHVFCVGSPAVDGLAQVQAAVDAPELIVAQHPVGASDAQERDWMTEILTATKAYGRVVCAPNGDPGCKGIRAAARTARVSLCEHLPRPRFLQWLAGANVIVGNSSAGLIEASVLRTPCVNIGSRQGGRETPSSVVSCDHGVQSIKAALAQAMAMDRRRLRHPYGSGRTGERIAQILSSIDWANLSVRKRNVY